MKSGTQKKHFVTKHFNQLNQNHALLILLVDGSELGESFPAGLGHKEPNKKCPKAADRPVYQTEDMLYKNKKGIGGMVQMVILGLLLGMKMVLTRNQPMEEEDGVQSKGTDE